MTIMFNRTITEQQQQKKTNACIHPSPSTPMFSKGQTVVTFSSTNQKQLEITKLGTTCILLLTLLLACWATFLSSLFSVLKEAIQLPQLLGGYLQM